MNESELQFDREPADKDSMSPLPKFHAKANKEAEERKSSARFERDRADSFLDSLDDLLDENER